MSVRQLRALGVTLHLTLPLDPKRRDARQPIPDAPAVYIAAPTAAAARAVGRDAAPAGGSAPGAPPRLYRSLHVVWTRPCPRPVLELMAAECVRGGGGGGVRSVREAPLGVRAETGRWFSLGLGGTLLAIGDPRPPVGGDDDPAEGGGFSGDAGTAAAEDDGSAGGGGPGPTADPPAARARRAAEGLAQALGLAGLGGGDAAAGPDGISGAAYRLPVFRFPRGGAAEAVARGACAAVAARARPALRPAGGGGRGGGGGAVPLSLLPGRTRPTVVVAEREADLAAALCHPWIYAPLAHECCSGPPPPDPWGGTGDGGRPPVPTPAPGAPGSAWPPRGWREGGVRLGRVSPAGVARAEGGEEAAAAAEAAARTAAVAGGAAAVAGAPAPLDLPPDATDDPLWAELRSLEFPDVAARLERGLADYRRDAALAAPSAAAQGSGPCGEGGSGLGADAALAEAVRSLPALRRRKALLDRHTRLATAVLKAVKRRRLDAMSSEGNSLREGGESFRRATEGERLATEGGGGGGSGAGAAGSPPGAPWEALATEPPPDGGPISAEAGADRCRLLLVRVLSSPSTARLPTAAALAAAADATGWPGARAAAGAALRIARRALGGAPGAPTGGAGAHGHSRSGSGAAGEWLGTALGGGEAGRAAAAAAGWAGRAAGVAAARARRAAEAGVRAAGQLLGGDEGVAAAVASGGGVIAAAAGLTDGALGAGGGATEGGSRHGHVRGGPTDDAEAFGAADPLVELGLVHALPAPSGHGGVGGGAYAGGRDSPAFGASVTGMAGGREGAPSGPPGDVVVFVVGGACPMEAAALERWGEARRARWRARGGAGAGGFVVLGGTETAGGSDLLGQLAELGRRQGCSL